MQGEKQGDQVGFLGTAMRHIDTVKEYADAWQKSRGSNTPLLREAATKFAKVWGSDAPTNLEAAARIAGPEVIKAIVSAGGSAAERIGQEKGFQPGASDEQILGALNVAQHFLAEQLPAKEAQANAVHLPHEKFVQMVGPEQYKMLQTLREKGVGGAKTSESSTSSGPAVGEVRRGYAFKGGDPKDQKNWEKVQ